MDYSFMPLRRLGFVATLLALALLHAPPLARAATPYEAQIGGFVAALLSVLITGEFAGRRPSNADAVLDRRVCRASDYDDLRAAAHDRVAFDVFYQRCKLVEAKLDSTHIHIIAHLPNGYCEILKTAFLTALEEQVYSINAPIYPPNNDTMVVEYKGSRYMGTTRNLARGAHLQAICQGDGSLRVSAPRKRR